MTETDNLKILLVDENRGRSAILERALVDNGQQVIAVLDSGQNLSAQTHFPGKTNVPLALARVIVT